MSLILLFSKLGCTTSNLIMILEINVHVHIKLKRKRKRVEFIYIPMDGDVVWNIIDHLNQKPISLSSNDARARELTIDCHDALGVAQPGDIFQCYLHI